MVLRSIVMLLISYFMIGQSIAQTATEKNQKMAPSCNLVIFSDKSYAFVKESTDEEVEKALRSVRQKEAKMKTKNTKRVLYIAQGVKPVGQTVQPVGVAEAYAKPYGTDANVLFSEEEKAGLFNDDFWTTASQGSMCFCMTTSDGTRGFYVTCPKDPSCASCCKKNAQDRPIKGVEVILE